MPNAHANAGEQIDAIMEQASHALVQRRYFETERLCLEALTIARHHDDYERIARILLPLQEARRQKRDQAIDAAAKDGVRVLDAVMPTPGEIAPGIYLVQPPRVGLDGRMLREAADKAEVPVLVVVREPTTRTGLVPIVTLGPVTLRVRVDAEPQPPEPAARKSKPAKGKAAKPAPKKPAVPKAPPAPSLDWVLAAAEALGDAAITDIDPTRPAFARADELLLRLESHPDHEKLHQAAMDAAQQASRDNITPPRKRDRLALDDELEGDEDEAEPDAEGDAPADDSV